MVITILCNNCENLGREKLINISLWLDSMREIDRLNLGRGGYEEDVVGSGFLIAGNIERIGR